MDKIFREIKQAIEEEMARQEGRPPSGSSRQQERDMSRYQAWLDEEQQRLRGPEPPPQQERSRPRADQVISEQPQRERREPRREQRPEERRQQERQRRQQQRSVESLEHRPDTTVRPERRERQQRESRHDRQTRSAYEQRFGRSDISRGVWQMMRSRRGLQQAILISEIIGKPVSMRKQDDHLIS